MSKQLLISEKRIISFRFPMVILYMIIAFNITAYTVVIQLDWLVVDSIGAKLFAWTLTIAAWWLSYVKRDKFISIF